MLRRRRLPVLLLILILAFSACADERQDAFSPKGEVAGDINRLQGWVFIAAGVVGVIVAALIGYAVVKYRRRDGDDETADPVQVHGNFRLEIGWTIAPAVLLAVVAIGTVATLFDLTENDSEAMRVKVYGQQWWWSYEYNLDDDPEPEIVTANDLVIPVGEKVMLDISSRDVIHSFWIPSLTGTMDAVPGRNHQLPIQADEPGVYDGQCKEFCGLSHANMRARAVAVSPREFERWLESQSQSAEEPSDRLAIEGKEQFEGLLCASCHLIRGVNDGLEVSRDFLLSGHAPDLTHFASRGVFASGMFRLYNDNGTVDRAPLEAWLRDAPSELPMAADHQPYRGMPNLNLTEEQIDQLVAYLISLGEPPDVTDDATIKQEAAP